MEIQAAMFQFTGIQRPVQPRATCIVSPAAQMGRNTRMLSSVATIDSDRSNAVSSTHPTRPVYTRVPLVRTNRLHNQQAFEPANRNREITSTPAVPPPSQQLQHASQNIAHPFQLPQTVMAPVPSPSFPQHNQVGAPGPATRPSTPVEDETTTRPSTPVPDETTTRPSTPNSGTATDLGVSVLQAPASNPCFTGAPILEACVPDATGNHEVPTGSTQMSFEIPGLVADDFAVGTPDCTASSLCQNTITAEAHPALPAIPAAFSLTSWGEHSSTIMQDSQPYAGMNDASMQPLPSFVFSSGQRWNSVVETHWQNPRLSQPEPPDHGTGSSNVGLNLWSQPSSWQPFANLHSVQHHDQPYLGQQYLASVPSYPPQIATCPQSTFPPQTPSLFPIEVPRSWNHQPVVAEPNVYSPRLDVPSMPFSFCRPGPRSAPPPVEPSTLVLEPQTEWYKRYEALQKERSKKEKKTIMPLFPGLPNTDLSHLAFEPRPPFFKDAKLAAIEKDLVRRLEIERRLVAEREARKAKRPSKRPREPRKPDSPDDENLENARPSKRRKVREEPAVSNSTCVRRKLAVDKPSRPAARQPRTLREEKKSNGQVARSCPNLISSFFGGLDVVRQALQW